MSTGENEQALRKIIDMTRLMAIAILCLHYYYYCYGFFKGYELSTEFTDRLLGNVVRTELYDSFISSKLIALGMLAISLLGAKGKKDEKLAPKTAILYLIVGLLVYFLSFIVLKISMPMQARAMLYMGLTSLGFLIIITGGNWLSRIIRDRLRGDIFNRSNETFPQEERLLESDESINLPTRYNLKGTWRKSHLNLINIYRGTLVSGSPGAGKSYFVINNVIRQLIEKQFTLFLYDFKFDDLSVIAYNAWLKNKHKYKVEPGFFVINFDDLNRSHRCNPLDPRTMHDITDATESARTILLGLNKDWQKKSGDFFVESALNFVTAVIWFLRKYSDGEYCTLPHVLELIQTPYEDLFSILQLENECAVYINAFISALNRGAQEQLEGQIASAKIAMARLSSPSLYYVLSGNDFKLDINNPKEPKIVTIGNNPAKIQIYGAVASLYINRMIKQVNQKGMERMGIVIDELPTIVLQWLDTLLGTARSNRVAAFLAIQNIEQLRKDYGREQADVIINIIGNLIVGQGTGETAKHFSQLFAKTLQDRESLSINRTDTSISKSKQLEAAINPSTISGLSSGEFVGIVSDNPDCKIELKTFHCEILNDHDAIKKETDAYKPIPQIRNVDAGMIQANYYQIKKDIEEIVSYELGRMRDDPSLQHLIIKS